MMDREKVIEQLEYAWKYIQERPNPTATPKATAMAGIKKAIALLKEQQPDVVRCKDCKDACIYSDDWVICTHIDSNGNDKHPVDWFCADGERR